MGNEPSNIPTNTNFPIMNSGISVTPDGPKRNTNYLPLLIQVHSEYPVYWHYILKTPPRAHHSIQSGYRELSSPKVYEGS
ncbi:hypothetical protein F383_05928 [Gossypium arboreum]|uniref:Uncharacterized protein n=1 Tax=Gossypium arboreum TaxID=29729 RepID=A0A0B0PQA0_GOSAR|nr:hypothetical protein F383_05928 [Gossypium arboreum]